LEASNWRSAQVAPQAVVPVGHAHVPALQMAPARQTTPQVPQLFTSVCELLQVPPQYRSDAVHKRQEPALQPWPDGHTRPQAPQLFTSVSTGMHAPPQTTVPVGHRQVPALHVASEGHTLPHDPQLALSVARVTQGAPHGAVPTGHAPKQAPATQLWPVAQAMVV
jgi:hypothetical protein